MRKLLRIVGAFVAGLALAGAAHAQDIEIAGGPVVGAGPITINGPVTLNTTANQTYTYPAASDTLAGVGSTEAITGQWTFNTGPILTNGQCLSSSFVGAWCFGSGGTSGFISTPLQTISGAPNFYISIPVNFTQSSGLGAIINEPVTLNESGSASTSINNVQITNTAVGSGSQCAWSVSNSSNVVQGCLDVAGGFNGPYLKLGSALHETATAPTVSGTGLGTSPVVTAAAGSGAIDITVGSSPSAANWTVTFASGASNGWACAGSDITSHSTTIYLLRQVGGTANTAVMEFFSTADAAAAPAASDHIRLVCAAL